jgi:hypothetical protein
VTYRAEIPTPLPSGLHLVTPGERRALLTPRLLRSLGRWTWRSGDPEHPVPIVLLAPPPSAGLQGPVAMRALADGLGMEPAGRRIPSIGTRARAVPGGFDVQFTTPACLLPVPASAEVVSLAAEAGVLLLAFGLDLLPPDTPWEAVAAYVGEGVATDRVWFGSVRVTGDGPMI